VLHIREAGCITPWGDEKATHGKLLTGQKSLELKPVFGASGDCVPLSTFGSIEATLPPAWLETLDPLCRRIPGADWGSAKHPIVITSSNFGIGSMLAFQYTQQPAHLDYAQAHTSVAHLLRRFGWGKHIHLLSHACVSADIGLQFASQLLRIGAAEKVLAFSFDFLSPFVSGGFHSLKILNALFPAPYEDREAGAIGLGEGAAFAVLTPTPGTFAIRHASTHNELYHMTGNRPDGSGFQQALTSLQQTIAGRKVWVKGHGTGTRDAGKLEAEAVAALFPESPLVSWKGGIGHTLGSCGLIELTLAMQSMTTGRAPGTVGSTGPCFSQQVQKEAFAVDAYDGVVLSSNAFGGAHACSLLTRT
jgi:3-oxoacyl-(acyl-carrier-protein) synthase